MVTQERVKEKMDTLAKHIQYDYENLKWLAQAMFCQIIHKEGDGKNRKS